MSREYTETQRQGRREAKKRFEKTIGGMIGKIYGSQKANSIERGHALPTYSRTELEEWLVRQELFHKLYAKWLESDCLSALKPSVDRIDDSKSYEFGNIRLMTWCENHTKGGRHSNHKGGSGPISKAYKNETRRKLGLAEI